MQGNRKPHIQDQSQLQNTETFPVRKEEGKDGNYLLLSFNQVLNALARIS